MRDGINISPLFLWIVVFPHCCAYFDLWCRKVYVGHRGICGKVDVCGSIVENACGFCIWTNW